MFGEIMMRRATIFVPAKIDQGESGDFLSTQLKPETLTSIAKASAYPLTFNLHQGYDHSYYFIADFIEGHLRFHARHLKA